MRPIVIPFILLSGGAFAGHLTPDQKIDLHHPGSSYHPPVAVDDACEVDIPCDVLANDTDEDGNLLTVLAADGQVNPDGTVTFPAAGTVSYTVTDGGTLVTNTDTGTVTVNGAPPPSGIVYHWDNPSIGQVEDVTIPDNYTFTFQGAGTYVFNGWERMLSKANGPNDQDHDIMISNGNGPVRVRACAGGNTITLFGGVLTTATQRIDVTYDGSFVVVFIDGIQVSSAAHSGLPCNRHQFMIAAQPPNGDNPYPGVPEFVTIRDFPMTGAEILADMGAPPPPPSPPPQQGNFVTPADIGVTVGPGVVDAYPTTVVGNQTISTPNTLLENVIVDGCVTVRASNFTMRNVVVTGGEFIQGVKDTRCWFPVWMDPGHSNALIEYSEIKCSHSNINVLVDGYADGIVRNNVLSGCDDAFRIDGDLGTLVIDQNVMHEWGGGAGSHADGLQIGSSVGTPRLATGTIQVTRNWFSLDNPAVVGSVTGALFATGQSSLTDILFENNRVSSDFGIHILRCTGQPSNHCTIRNNTLVDVGVAFDNFVLASVPAVASCNVWETGEFIEQSLFDGVTHVTSGC